MLVKLQKVCGAFIWVNPKDVTSIEKEHTVGMANGRPVEGYHAEHGSKFTGRKACLFWVRGNSGYGTYNANVLGSGDEVAEKLNTAEEAMNPPASALEVLQQTPQGRRQVERLARGR